ncbi:uncharacterized protein G2W53_038535 [Senna tora]|uniref:Uncharacterized protein n=1 Tax=Senna tora TaxID=362788 RepID=A0A834W6Y8_9FABA|nr:uncharacterized protein G2W53_038535 [Senna tora]
MEKTEGESLSIRYTSPPSTTQFSVLFG